MSRRIVSKERKFTIVWNQTFQMGLTPNEIAVYCLIKSYATAETPTAFPSMSTLSARLGLKANKVVREAIKTLRALKMLEVEARFREGAQTSNLYIITDPSEWAPPPFPTGNPPPSPQGTRSIPRGIIPK